jgi:hypothetical protein
MECCSGLELPFANDTTTRKQKLEKSVTVSLFNTDPAPWDINYFGINGAVGRGVLLQRAHFLIRICSFLYFHLKMSQKHMYSFEYP